MKEFTKRDDLRKPLPKEAIKPHPSKTYLSTIKAIYVTERFNDVFGINGWQVETDMLHWFERTSAKGKPEFTVVSKTTITFPEYGIKHECIAGSTNEDFGDAAKGATTDAITKIGSYIEVGIDVFKGLKTEKDNKPAARKTPEATTPPTPPKEKDWLNLNTDNYRYAKKRILETKGTPSPVTIETIKATFRLSKEVEETLTKETA